MKRKGHPEIPGEIVKRKGDPEILVLLNSTLIAYVPALVILNLIVSLLLPRSNVVVTCKNVVLRTLSINERLKLMKPL